MERAFSVDDIVGTFWKQDSNETAPATGNHASTDTTRFSRDPSFSQLSSFSQRMSRSSSEWAFQEFLREHAVGIPPNPSATTSNRLEDSTPNMDSSNSNFNSQSAPAPTSSLAQGTVAPINEYSHIFPPFPDGSGDLTNVNPEYTALLQHRLALACAMASSRVGGSAAALPLSKLSSTYPAPLWPSSLEPDDVKPGNFLAAAPNVPPLPMGPFLPAFPLPQVLSHAGPTLTGRHVAVASPTPLTSLTPLAPATPLELSPDTPVAPATPLTPGTPGTPVPIGIPALPPRPSQITSKSNAISSREGSEDEEQRSEGEDELVASLEHLTDPDDIKRVKRMLSNRESARRSRRRKQAHLNELETQVNELQKENSNLASRLHDIGRKYNEAAVDNRVLKSDVEALRAKVQMAEEMLGRTSHMTQYMYGIPTYRSNDSGLGLSSSEMPYYPRACRPGQVSTALTELGSSPSYGNGQGDICQSSNASQLTESLPSSVKMERTPSMQRVASLEHLQKRIRGNRGSLWPSTWEMEDSEALENSSDDEERPNS